MSGVPAHADLIEVLAPTYERAIDAVTSRPYEYASSHPLTLVTVRFRDGGRDVLVLKDLDERRMLDAASTLRSAHPMDGRHELTVYRHVLVPAGLGPRCQAMAVDPERGRHWLLTERVAGVELWQIGEPPIWELVAGWLAAMHASFLDRTDELSCWLPRLDGAWFTRWSRRALAQLSTSSDARAAQLRAVVAAADVDERLHEAARTLVHGEFYPSNVLVRDELSCARSRVVPIDWETAALGSPMLDLAALCSGWDERTRSRLVAAYGAAVDAAELASCRLHLALRWLATPREWRPPAAHRRDWIGEALRAAEEVAAA